MKFLIILFSLSALTFAEPSKDIKQAEFMTGLDKAPPMLDEDENNKTILGIDSNKNGIRDDVEVYIHENFKGEDKYYERMLAFQLAFNLQERYKIAMVDMKQFSKVVHPYEKFLSCNQFVNDNYTKDYNKGYRMRRRLDKLLGIQANTKLRLILNSKIDDFFSGKSAQGLKANKRYCKFKLR